MRVTRGQGGGGSRRATPLRLVLLGIRWRRWASVATLVVAALAAAAAMLGPMYASGADDSLVRQRLVEVPAITTRVEVRATKADNEDMGPVDLLATVTIEADDPGFTPGYGPIRSALLRDRIVVANSAGQTLGLAPVAWRDGQCVAVPVVEGVCPAGAGQVMVSRRLADDAALRIGDTVQVGLGARPADHVLTVVGVYDQTRPDPSIYVTGTPATFAPPGGLGTGPPTLDELLVDQETALSGQGQVIAVAQRALDAVGVPLSRLPALVEAVESATHDAALSGVVGYSVSSGLPELVGSYGPERSALRSSILAVSAQIVVLVWFVLFIVVASATDERAGEVAVAKLRGRRTRSTLAFAVAEPLLLTALAVPIGLVLAWALVAGLTDRWFVPGTPVTVDGAVLVAAALAFLGGVVACLLAGRRVLTTSVTDELRRVSGRRRAGGLVVDAVVVTLALVSLGEVRGGSSSGLALLAPGLVSLSVALLAVRGLPLIVAQGVRRTRGSSKVASFLAVRNVARRPGGMRLVVLLTVAVGLAVFAVDASAVAAGRRTAEAAAEVGAPTVVALSGVTPTTAVETVRALDPDGAWAMVATQLPLTSAEALLAVDASRLVAVTSWTPDPGAGTVSSVAAALRPPALPPVPVRGRLTVQASLTSLVSGHGARPGSPGLPLESFPTTLSVSVRQPDGRVSLVDLGTVKEGDQELAADLPGCSSGCLLRSFVLQHLGGFAETESHVGLTGLADADGPLALPGTPDSWRAGLAPEDLVAPDLIVSPTVEGVADGVSIDLEAAESHTVIAELADHPVVLPVLASPDADLDDYEGPTGGSYATGLSGGTLLVQPAVVPSFLPRSGSRGFLADLGYASAADPSGTTIGEVQVWLGAAAPADAVDRLAAAGLAVARVETIEEREAQLSRDGNALAFPYFVVAAAFAVALAGGALLVTAAIGARRRSYELAAVRLLGAGRRTLEAAGRRELLALMVFGTVVGCLAGLLAARLVLPSLLGTEATAAVGTLPEGPAWLPVAAVLAVVLGVAAFLAHLAARRIARLSVPDRLREAEA